MICLRVKTTEAEPQAIAQRHSHCDFVNRWALAPGLNRWRYRLIRTPMLATSTQILRVAQSCLQDRGLPKIEPGRSIRD